MLTGSAEAPRRPPGIEHWLPLFYDELDTVFDYAPQFAVVLDVDADEQRTAVFEQTQGAYESRSVLGAARTSAHSPFPPLEPCRLHLDEAEWERRLQGRRVLTLVRADSEAMAPAADPVPRFADQDDPVRALIDSFARSKRLIAASS